jgi:hypothetical protein
VPEPEQLAQQLGRVPMLPAQLRQHRCMIGLRLALRIIDPAAAVTDQYLGASRMEGDRLQKGFLRILKAVRTQEMLRIVRLRAVHNRVGEDAVFYIDQLVKLTLRFPIYAISLSSSLTRSSNSRRSSFAARTWHANRVFH